MDKNKKIQEILERGVDEVIDRKHLEEKLKSGKKLRIKLGIDPTSPRIHIGRAITLWKLREFQDLGHKVVFIIGDFTGLIGDTSDKDAERPMLNEKQIKTNMKDYLKQVGKILNLKKTEAYKNSEWLKKLDYYELAKQADQFGLNEITSRENVAKRMKAGKRVSLREVLYPLMQGYDSVAIKADVEVGGTDQRFNLLAGRKVQKLYKQEPQDIMTFHLLEGTDGRKMSSSWGNVINISDNPNDMFGKVMSLQDNLIIKYFELVTKVPLDKVKNYQKDLMAKANPRDLKIILAKEIVGMYHGKTKAQSSAKEWERVFSKKDKPSIIKLVKVKAKNLVDVLAETKLASSKSEARRLIEQGGVKVDDVVVRDINAKPLLKSSTVLQVGKRKFVKIR